MSSWNGIRIRHSIKSAREQSDNQGKSVVLKNFTTLGIPIEERTPSEFVNEPYKAEESNLRLVRRIRNSQIKDKPSEIKMSDRGVRAAITVVVLVAMVIVFGPHIVHGVLLDRMEKQRARPDPKLNDSLPSISTDYMGSESDCMGKDVFL